MGLLDGGLQQIVGAAFSGIMLDGTLHIKTLVSDGQGGTTETEANHPIKAMVGNYSAEYRARSGIPATDVQIIALQAGMSVVPTTDSQITVPGFGKFDIKSVSQDPAKASWEMQGSPV